MIIPMSLLGRARVGLARASAAPGVLADRIRKKLRPPPPPDTIGEIDPRLPATAQVVADPAGLGYFRSRPWMVRYAGNEEEGYRLNAAFRIQQNIIGLDVGAVTNAPGVDISATGRMAAGCRSCHYDSYFALDKVAKILSRKTGPDDNPTFTGGTGGRGLLAPDGHPTGG